VNDDDENQDRNVVKERERLFRAYPDEYSDGARRGYTGNKRYPRGFDGWPIERRNAWYAGWNVGYCDRKAGR